MPNAVTLRQPLTLAECQLVREWRNAPEVVLALRSGWISEEYQARFYRDTIRDQASPHMYWAVEVDGVFAGMAGLTDVVYHEDAEISLILGPAFRGRGLGRVAVDAIIAEAWRIKLRRIRGEVYHDAPAKWFWLHLLRDVAARLDTFREHGPSMTWIWGKLE